MSAVAGIFGSIIGVVGSAVAGSVTVLVVFLLFKSGTMGDAWAFATAIVTGGWGALTEFWGFLRELAAAV